MCSLHTSSNRGGARAAECWDSLKADSWALLSSEGEQKLPRQTRKRVRLLGKTDVRKILLQPMLEFFAVAVLIRRTTEYTCRTF